MSSEVDRISELIFASAEEGGTGSSDSTCLTPREMAQVFGAKLPSTELASRKAHIARCDSCFREYLAILGALPDATAPDLEEADGDASEQAAPVIPLPWVVGWENEGEAHVHLQAASSGGYEPLSLDVGVGGMVGTVELRFEPVYDGLNPGVVVIYWHVGFLAPGGWKLSLYRQGEPEAVFTTHIKDTTEGTVTVTKSALGFDPVTTPLACGFGPA